MKYSCCPLKRIEQKALDKKELNAQSRNENGIAQRLSPNDKYLSPLLTLLSNH